MPGSRSPSPSLRRSRSRGKISSRQFALAMAASGQSPGQRARSRTRSRRRKSSNRSRSRSVRRRMRKIRGGEGEDQTSSQPEGQPQPQSASKERKTIYSSVNVTEEEGLRNSVNKLMNANSKAALDNQEEKRKDTLQQMFDTKNWLGLLTAVQKKTREDAMQQIERLNTEAAGLRTQLSDTQNIDEKQMNVVFNLGLRWIHNRGKWMEFENDNETAFFDKYGTEFLGYGRVVVDALAQLALLKHVLTDGQDENANPQVKAINDRWNAIANLRDPRPGPDVIEEQFIELSKELNAYAKSSKVKGVLTRPGVEQNFMNGSEDYSPWIDLLLLKNARGDLKQDIQDLEWVVDSYNLDQYNDPNEDGARSTAYRNELSPQQAQDEVEKKMRQELIETLRNYKVRSPVATGKPVTEADTEWPEINFWDDQSARIQATLEIMKNHDKMLSDMISGIPALMRIVENGWPESGLPFEQYAFAQRFPTGRLHWLDTDGGKDGQPGFSKTAESVRKVLGTVTRSRSKAPDFKKVGAASVGGGVYGNMNPRPMSAASAGLEGQSSEAEAPVKPPPSKSEAEEAARAKGKEGAKSRQAAPAMPTKPPVAVPRGKPATKPQNSGSSTPPKPTRTGLNQVQKPNPTIGDLTS